MVEGKSGHTSRHAAVSAIAAAVALVLSSSAALALGTSGPRSMGADAIGGTGRTASSDAIGGTGRTLTADAIGGTGRKVSSDAIGGTGRTLTADAIGGTGRKVSSDAIGGTGRTASSDAIGGTGRTERSTLFAGQVEAVDPTASTMTLLGQTIPTPAAKTLAAGQHVAVLGYLTAADKIIVTAIRDVPEYYVAGASGVKITGKITAIDPALGLLMIGRQVVDYTGMLGSGQPSFAVGSVVRISGIQPVGGGVILATD